MKDKLDLVKHNSLYRSTVINALAQLLSVGICTAILFLFVALTYSEITLPRYTTKYAQKDTQQLINLIVAVVAVIIGIWLSHCRRLTNEAETRSELRNERLTIPRLHVHFEAAGGSKAAVVRPALQNRAVWKLVAIYMFAMIMYGFLTSVLSVIFVIEAVISDKGEQVPAYIPIGVEVPLDVDPCSISLYEPGCSYALGLQALSSQLVTYQNYTIAGVMFEPPNGTLGMPYYAMKHFSDEVQSSSFDEERRQYCLPVLDPQLIHCTELPFDQFLSETTTGNYLRYHSLNASQVNYSGQNNTIETLKSLEGLGVYKTVVNFPSRARTHINERVDDQGLGTMLVKMNPDYSLPDDPPMWTLVAATDYSAHSYGHASNLYKLMYGHYPDLSFLSKLDVSYFTFVAKCEYTDIQYRDNYLSSWRKVDFTLKNGVSRANVTNERCPNPKGNWTSGFDDLRYAIVGATTVLSSTDGYSPLFNLFEPKGSGTDYFAGMSRLDAIVNSLYHITSTFWTAQSHEVAMKNQTIYDQPIMMTKYPHLYVIRIDWTPATYIGLILALFICLSAWVLGIRWLLATYHFGFEAETWNLLRPIDLMAYSLASYKDLVHDLNTKEHRQSTMRGKIGSFLREHPVEEGTENLIGLVTSNSQEKLGSDTSASSPVNAQGVKVGQVHSPRVTVHETNRRSSDVAESV